MHLIYALHSPADLENRYIGRSSSGITRPKGHLADARRKTENGKWLWNKHLHNWIRSLPEMRYEFRVVEKWDGIGDPNVWLNERETYWIAHFRNLGHRLTNATLGGGGILGYHHDLEGKMKIAEAGRNQVWTDERRERISSALVGNPKLQVKRGPYSDEHRQNISVGLTGLPRPNASGANHWTTRLGDKPHPIKGRPRPDITERLKGKPGATKGMKFPDRKGMPVRELNSGLIFDQAIKAAKHFNVSVSTVTRCLQDGKERKGLRFELV